MFPQLCSEPFEIYWYLVTELDEIIVFSGRGCLSSLMSSRSVCRDVGESTIFNSGDLLEIIVPVVFIDIVESSCSLLSLVGRDLAVSTAVSSASAC